MLKSFKLFKNILIRVDYNVPIQNDIILDLNRIESSLPTIRYFLKHNKKIILMSHLGRPKGLDKNYSLEKLIKPLEKLLGLKVLFIPEITSESVNLISNKLYSIVLLENLRFYPGEKTNDIEFARLLSNCGDIYINDAFGVSHRNHASVSAITQFFENQKYKGLLLESELRALNKLKQSTINPYTIIVGGSKIGSKIYMLQSFLNVADNIIIGGGMAFPFIKYLGGDIGSSIFKEQELVIVEEFLNQAKQSKTKIILPIDCLITNNIKERGDQRHIDIMKIPQNYMGVDIGVKTIKLFCDVISSSKLIMWNGPMGISEIDDFSNGTKEIAESVAKVTNQGSYSLLGGGDTISEISKWGLKNKFSYISTGGGAMLEFFKNKNLPGTKDLDSMTKF
tara:strand:+ start:235 stop:1416 length:1182 start_codon:yes stop_codon:yes gene_type:complete